MCVHTPVCVCVYQYVCVHTSVCAQQYMCVHMCVRVCVEGAAPLPSSPQDGRL